MREMLNTCGVEGCLNPCWKSVCRTCAFKIRNGEIPEQLGVKRNEPCIVPECRNARYTKNTDYCRAHYEVSRAGREPSTKRRKTPNHGEKPSCNVPGCPRTARSRMLCDRHYARSKYKNTSHPCKTEGCEVRVTGDETRCATHRKQFKKYGFSWTGQRPAPLYEEWRARTLGECGVLDCDTTRSSANSRLCVLHRSDAARKKLTHDQYIELMAATSCASCGSEGVPLVTDHDHSKCGHRQEYEMCALCIRGRLCSGCNTALGLLNEDPERVRRLNEYLARHGR